MTRAKRVKATAKVGGRTLPYGGPLDEAGELTPGTAYGTDGGDVEFAGTLTRGLEPNGPGLYYDEESGELVLFEERAEIGDDPRVDEILRKLAEDPPPKPRDDLPPGSNQLIVYEPAPGDDDMVTLLKSTVNDMRLTFADVYRRAGGNVEGCYNLIYGLRRRPTITYQSFKRYAEALGFRVEIKLIPEEEGGGSRDGDE